MCFLSFIIRNVNYLHKHMMDNMKKMKAKCDFQFMSLVVYAINFKKKTNEPKNKKKNYTKMYLKIFYTKFLFNLRGSNKTHYPR
jgi:hypothetical protein